jgi:hypothetical protein
MGCQFDEVVLLMYVSLRKYVFGFSDELDERVRRRFPGDIEELKRDRRRYIEERIVWGNVEMS